MSQADDSDALIAAAHELGARLWFAEGGQWEAAPAYEHQDAIDRIRASIHSLEGAACACVHKSDVNVRIRPKYHRRPDISIWCGVPERTDTGTAITIPRAVVEILSKGYERKDLDSIETYLSAGVENVILYNWETGWVLHVTATGRGTYTSPVTLELAMGCTITV